MGYPGRRLSRTGNPLLIIAEDVEGGSVGNFSCQQAARCSSTWLQLKLQGLAHRRASNAPRPIAVVTGGQVISEDVGLSLDKVEVEATEMLGTAQKVTIY